MILLGDAAKVLRDFNDNCIDLTVTSPPYDNLRTYNGFVFDFETIAAQLYRVSKQGGVLVWIIGDATVEGSETGTSFKQILYFMQLGFSLHDTMIYNKQGFRMPEFTRYHQVFEYMFVLSKGRPKTFNPIEDRTVKTPNRSDVRYRREGDTLIRTNEKVRAGRFGARFNIWTYSTGYHRTKDHVSDHPALMPEDLAHDHLKSWSNEGDLILDPMCGSGTTLKAAHQLRRKWIGIEINADYVKLAKKRLMPYIQQQRLTHYNASTTL